MMMTLWLSGCVHYHAEPIEPGYSAEQFAARRLTEPQLHAAVDRLMPQSAAVWPPAAWDRSQLLAIALAQNPALVLARAQARAALARETTASETPNPDLTLQSEYARRDQHPWLYGLSLSWLLRSPTQRHLDVDIAALGTGIARLELMNETWVVRHTLANALSDWESSRRRLDLLAQLAGAQQRLLALERLRVEAGEDAPVELIASLQASIEIEQQETELHAAADAAQVAVAKVLGMPPQALDGIKVLWPDWGDPPALDSGKLRDVRERALLSRADLGVAIQDYAVAESKLHLAIARQYPQINLEPGYYWDHGIAKFPFNVGFTVPMNGNRGEIAEARAQRNIAAQRMLALQADIYRDIAAAERAELISRESAAQAARLLESARHQQQTAELGLRLGAVGTQEQLVAEIFAARAELEVVQVRSRLQVSRNALEDVLQSPLSGPELALAGFGS